jgi:spore coat protein U-like protein
LRGVDLRLVLLGGATALALGYGLLRPSEAAQSCTVNVGPVRFGSYSPFASSDLSSVGAVIYRCTTPSPITVTLDRGTGGSFSPRRMKQGSFTLDYNLYLDAGSTMTWGDGTGGTQVYHDPAPRSGETAATIFGRVPAGQRSVRVGAYFDTVTVTITF